MSAGRLTHTLTFFKLAGDADGSGIVDQEDYSLWYGNYGAVGTELLGDMNGDNSVDQLDYVIWYSQYGSAITRV